MTKEAYEKAISQFSYDAGTGEFLLKSTGRPPCDNGRGYFYVSLLGSSHAAHRVAWLMHYKEWPQGNIDHKNGVKTDNRIDNLRIATSQQNNANRRVTKRSLSGLKGVALRNGRWSAQIMVNGKNLRLGMFDTKEEAGMAYKKAAGQHFGEFAK